MAGWGRAGWGIGPWGQPAVTIVEVSGVAGTSALGTISVLADANTIVSGVSSTSALGSLSVTGEANVTPNSQVGTSALGTIIAKGSANVGCPAVSATLGNVSVTISGDCSVILTTGLSGT